MKTKLALKLATFLMSLSALIAQPSTSFAQTPAFTYQGRLNQNGAPVTGPFDVRFTLFGGATGGSPVSNPITNSVVGVTNGLFTVQLDFGSDTFTGADRWLDIAVRPAGNGTFTPLNPRQPITATPYAVTALKVPGVSGSSLNSANDGPLNVVVVDNFGKVGVGTTSPASQLHVVSKPNEAPPRLQSAGNTDFCAGWDFYHGATGKGYVGVPDANASIAPGELVLFSGPNTKVSLWPGQNRALTANPAGNVGVGTDAPQARLDVRGDVRLGPNGQFRAASGEENLRIVRGIVNGSGGIITGSGFTATRISNGLYEITFSTPFAGLPAVSATADFGLQGNRHCMTDQVASGTAKIRRIRSDAASSEGEDGSFHFTAIGPR